MDDQEIHGRIEELVAEEHALWERESRGEAVGDERERLHELRVALDRLWDLLRQRRALARAGLDPEGAHERNDDVVEHYEQ